MSILIVIIGGQNMAKKVLKKIKKKEVKKKEVKEKAIGKVFTYFARIGVAGIELTGKLKVGDTIHVKGATTDFEQKVNSIQIENKTVDEAKKGDSIGIKLKDRVRPGDKVYLK